MLGFVNAIAGAGSNKARERRGSGRILTKLLNCPFGEVVDLSMTGMRIRARFRPWFLPKSFRPIELSLPGEKHPLRARAVWMRRRGLGYEIGFDFDAMNAGQRAALASIARTAIDTEFMGLKPVSDAA